MARAKIHLLPAELRNQIAAGEVVERPASVVKELVENALDAKADEIRVTVEDGGQGLICVEDNGMGIPKDELELAVTRHATSKLQTAADLSAISSYGFRGEALPSIASVSKFRIVSKTKDEDAANELLVNFGDITESAPASLRQGTLIEVRDLFFNIPARLKFLKNPATELKRATELFVRLALAADNVSMSLVSGSRTVMEFFSHEDKKDKLAKIWSKAIIEDLVPVDYSARGMHVSGFISNPRSVQPRADRMLFYVNGRAVNDKLMLKAIRQAYAGKITTRDYPQCLLFLALDPREVDVNVHPAKSEVRFRDEKALFALIAEAVKNSLANCPDYFSVKALQEEQTASPVTEAKFGDLYTEPAERKEQAKPQGFWGKADYESRLAFVKDKDKQNSYAEVVTEYFETDASSQNFQTDTFFAKQETGEEQTEKTLLNQTTAKNISFDDVLSAEPFAKSANYQSVAEPAETLAPLSKNFNAQSQNACRQQEVLPYGLEYMGQVAETYLLLKKDNDTLLILDQHAVHERILYEEMKKGQIQSRNLLCPLELSLHKSEENRYFSVKETLEQLGFSLQIKENGQKESGLTVQVTAIPMRYDRVTAMGFLQEILAEKMDNLDSIWVHHACKSAIKANTPLDTGSAIKLILQWLATEEPDNCPHGRPSVIHFSGSDLEKLFKRKF